MKRLTRIFTHLALILTPVISLFLLLEVTARLREYRHPPMIEDIGQGFGEESRLFMASGNGFYITRPEKKASFQEQRFERRKSRSTFRIFALGGSSVNYLHYEFSVLRQRLEGAFHDQYDQVQIINCGGLSYGSHRLVLLTAEILNYEPDLVLLYSGHNEFEEIQQLHLADLGAVRVQGMLSRSALYRFIRDWRARRHITRLEEAQTARQLAVSLPDGAKSWMHRFTPEEIAERMDAYRSNLETIVRLCGERNVPLIIGTVPSNLYRPNLPGEDGRNYEEVLHLFEQKRFVEGLALGRTLLRHATPRHQSSDAENEIIRDLAAVRDLPLADVEAAIIAAEPDGVPGQTLFSDHCHLNPEGNRIWREVYEARILELLGTGGTPKRHSKHSTSEVRTRLSLKYNEGGRT